MKFKNVKNPRNIYLFSYHIIRKNRFICNKNIIFKEVNQMSVDFVKGILLANFYSVQNENK